MGREPIFESLLDALFADAELRAAMEASDLERVRVLLEREALPSREELLDALAKDAG
jgi:hypothetical protein